MSEDVPSTTESDPLIDLSDRIRAADAGQMDRLATKAAGMLMDGIISPHDYMTLAHEIADRASGIANQLADIDYPQRALRDAMSQTKGKKPEAQALADKWVAAADRWRSEMRDLAEEHRNRVVDIALASAAQTTESSTSSMHK